jgi:formate hydrogenlyase subunit 3/multisubunit Na+/H+ antiporter MnhD subunit
LGAALFISMGVAFLLSIPLLTASLAKRTGRNPKVWFFIGMLLPLISSIILVLLKDKSANQKEQ